MFLWAASCTEIFIASLRRQVVTGEARSQAAGRQNTLRNRDVAHIWGDTRQEIGFRATWRGGLIGGGLCLRT